MGTGEGRVSPEGKGRSNSRRSGRRAGARGEAVPKRRRQRTGAVGARRKEACGQGAGGGDGRTAREMR